MSLHPIVEAVTARIVDRSAESRARYLELVKLYFDYMLTPVAENDYVMSAETFQELRERTCWDCANTIYPFLTNQTK